MYLCQTLLYNNTCNQVQRSQIYILNSQMIHTLPFYQFSPSNIKPKELETLSIQILNYLSTLNPQTNTQDQLSLANTRIQLAKLILQSESNPTKKGRGGNNIAENIKKSVLSLIKRKLPTNIYDQFQQRFIKTFKIKSQKQNLVLIFMFLEILHQEQKVQRRQIVDLILQIKLKIEKYISNSTAKMQAEEWRTEFHQKNIVQFRKFLQFDLDFSTERNYEELKKQIDSLYLRKKQEFKKAQLKIRKIIQSASSLRKIFSIQDSQTTIDVQNKSSNENQFHQK